MIELQAINNIIACNNLEDYIGAGVLPKHFKEHRVEYDFILNHFNRYNKAPDIGTFSLEFPDTDIFDVFEPTEYIVSNLFEQYLFAEGVALSQKFGAKLEKNSYEGLSYVMTKAEELLQLNTTSANTNINDMVDEKIADIDSKRKQEGLIGIPTGFKELDQVLMGWQKGQELVTIVGRVNQGKSWILLATLAAAHKAGYKVLLYSGEMSKESVAYRVDTLQHHYSNRQITWGTISDSDYEKYKEDIKHSAKHLNEFQVYTPKDLGGRMLDIPMLKHLIKKHKPDIVGIDQLSLMTDYRGAREKRLQLGNITMDLFNLSEEFSIPILADAQANRNKADMDNPENPELSDLAESDAIGQNSSRVISLVQTKAGLSLKITKNRYGENNKKFLYVWDIDTGNFRYSEVEETETKSNNYPTPEPEVEVKPKNRRQRKMKEDLF